jgi:5-dehydro-2-deoxygluconokinase
VTILAPERFELTYYRENCADLALSTEHVDRAPLADSRLVFVTGTALCGDPSRTATIHAAKTAQALGAIVVVDIDYRRALWPDPTVFGAAVRTLLPHADFAIGTAEEIGAAGDHECEATAVARLLDFGVRAVILKRGGEGAVVHRRGADAVAIPAYRVAVVNVLGAGDAFASGFIYGVLHGWSLDESVRIGNATGAIVATRHGCANFMPTLPEVHAFLTEADGQQTVSGN